MKRSKSVGGRVEKLYLQTWDERFVELKKVQDLLPTDLHERFNFNEMKKGSKTLIKDLGCRL